VPDWGAGSRSHKAGEPAAEETVEPDVEQRTNGGETGYKLQSMKWGLIPFWTKRNPDYGSMLKTINCRDDSLASSGGMWHTMKQKKRCVVICQGFYEWLKKNGGKEKVPHFIKRKDGGPMLMAGLWDCVQYEGMSHITELFEVE
jgi:putative SOS response-associated peptidase YedK